MRCFSLHSLITAFLLTACIGDPEEGSSTQSSLAEPTVTCAATEIACGDQKWIDLGGETHTGHGTGTTHDGAQNACELNASYTAALAKVTCKRCAGMSTPCEKSAITSAGPYRVTAYCSEEAKNSWDCICAVQHKTGFQVQVGCAECPDGTGRCDANADAEPLE